MARANEESRVKSDRVSQAMRRRQLKARDQVVINGVRSVPCWLRVNAVGKYELVPPMVDAVRDMYQMSADGMGRRAIVRALTAKGVRPPRGKYWALTTIQQILCSDAVLGVYQPCSRKVDGARRGRGAPVGEPIAGVYPAIVTADLARRARAAIVERRTGVTSGPKGAEFTNLFSGLVWCRCGSRMWLHDRGKKQGGRSLVCSAQHGGRRHCSSGSFNYVRFERTFLDHVAEMDLQRVNRELGAEEKLLQEQLAQIDGEIALKKSQIDALVRAVMEMQRDRADARTPGAIAEKIAELEAGLKHMERDKQAAEGRLKRTTGARHRDHAGEIERLRATMKDKHGDELFRVRAALASEIRRIARRITFDSKTGTAEVEIAGLAKLYILAARTVATMARAKGGVQGGVRPRTVAFSS
jgi:hypothetical protein